MILNEKQKKDFQEAARPLMKFLSDYHPHIKIIVDGACAEMLEGVSSFRTVEYVKN